MLIKTSGTYRGGILDHAVGKSSGGFPQWMVSLTAVDIYDYDTETWVNCEKSPERDIAGYLCLFGSKGNPTFHVQDIMAAVEWDGKSLKGLNDLDLTGVGIQFTVGDDVYEGATVYKVVKVSPYDDVPHAGGVRKMADADLQSLDAQYAALLKQQAGPAKISKAPAVAPVTPVTPAAVPGVVTRKPRRTKVEMTAAAAPAVPASSPVVPFEKDPALQDDGSEPDPAIAEVAAAKPATAPVTAPPAAAPVKPSGPMTKEVAWANCVQMRAKTITDKELTKSWQNAVRSIGKPDASMTPEDWGKVCGTVCDEVGVF